MVNNYSKGLEFESNGDGTCCVIGVGTCTDANIIIPPTSPDGEKVIKIDDNAFYFDTILDEYFCMNNGLDVSMLDDNIESITIPEGVTTIGCGAFQNRRLKAINFPSTLIHIGSECCSGCCNLSSINIPSAVRYIGEFAFYNCVNLQKISLPDGIITIEIGTFVECRNLQDIHIPDSVKTISTCAFDGCESLKEVSIPKSVTTFKGCSNSPILKF